MNKVLLATMLLSVAALATDVKASMLLNGDFQTGDLTGWTTYTTANGTIGVPSVTSFNTTGVGASLAATFNVGNISNPGNNGGGIFQAFNHTGGDLSVSIDVATVSGFGNADAGEFSLFVSGTLVDFIDFSDISGGVTERGTLSGTITNLAAGNYEFRVLITRSFETDRFYASAVPG